MKPQPKRTIGIISAHERDWRITFHTDPGTAQNLTAYGRVLNMEGTEYLLIVDSRYDFEEVLAYLESLNKETEA